MRFREYLEEETRLEFELFESIHLDDPGWIADESVMDIVRGTGSVIKGVAQTGAGVMSMGDEAIARAMGAGTKGRFKGGWDRFSRGVGNIGSGLSNVIVGSPSPARAKPDVSAVQNSAVQRRAAPENVQRRAPEPVKKKPLRITVGKQEDVGSGLQSLINQYRAAKSGGERNRILATISMKYPQWYQAKLAQAKNREKRGRTES